MIELPKSTSNGDAKISPKNQTNHPHPDLHASGFHNRPATRAGKLKITPLLLRQIDSFRSEKFIRFELYALR